MTIRTVKLPEGLALYLRKYSAHAHGSPKQLMKKYVDNGATWIAIAGPWDDTEGLRYINNPAVCKTLCDAASSAGLQPYIWGYPWQGREEAFADAMKACSGVHNRTLLDPELGANPSRSSTGTGMKQANAGATKLVKLMYDRYPDGICGLSTYSSGVRLKWFPLKAYATALSDFFPGRSFIGGQTYTDDKVIETSIAEFGRAAAPYGLDVVPNFGTYARVNGVVRSKTAQELDAHFLEFIDDDEPIDALIGWADNFMKPELWRSFARMADRMKRGATCL